MNTKLHILGAVGLTLVAGIISGSAVYNFFTTDDPPPLRGQVMVSQDAPVYNYSPEEAAQGVTLHAGAHNFFSCTASNSTAIRIHNSDSAIQWWVYEFTGNEPSFNGRYYFSSSLRTQSPYLEQYSGLTEFTAEKRYYIATEKDLTFRCSEGLFVNAFCGDGVISGEEECDAGDRDESGCSEDCDIRTGYTCHGEPSACTRLIPDLPVLDGSSSSSRSWSIITESFPSSSSSSSSSSSHTQTYSWALNATDDAAEVAYHSRENPTLWGQCDNAGKDHCIRYVSYKTSDSAFSLRVRVDLDPYDLVAEKYDFVAASLWKQNPNGTWLEVTAIAPDRWWGEGLYSVFERSLTAAPGVHTYKVLLHKGRVNANGIPTGPSETLEEILFDIVMEEPDPEVSIQELETQFSTVGSDGERVHYTGRISGFNRASHMGFINWGRGLQRFPVADDGTFNFSLSTQGPNPGNKLYLHYCPVNLMVLNPTPFTVSNPLKDATIYDRKIICPFE